MVLPITKKAAASCAKNMELNSITKQVDDFTKTFLVEGAKGLGESKKSVDVRAAIEGGMKNAMPEQKTKEPSEE
jgi:hypothetical protein